MDNAQNSNIQTISDADAERIADSLAAALENRRQRAERSVINSFAQQNHLSPGQIEELIRQRRERQGQSLPENLQSVIDERFRAADNRLINAEIREIGAQLGLIDTEAAFALMDKSQVFVDDSGSVNGVREALQELIKNKPYLAGQTHPIGTGRPGNFPRGHSDAMDYASRLAQARSSGNNTLAAAIISEAAGKGIYLR